MKATTPLMKQFLEIKGSHPDTILFFRVGDFYEMFYEDAVKASKILQITLTSRDKNSANPIPLCGVPYHAASAYIARLIRSGESIAVCEQVEAASAAKGIVRREVVRVITPGTVIEPELLSEKENNFLAALNWKPRKNPQNARDIGLACIDLSTGDFQMLAEDMSWPDIEAELMKIAPKEILLSSHWQKQEGDISPFLKQWSLRFVPAAQFQTKDAETVLTTHFKVHSTAAFGGGALSLAAAGALLRHLETTQKKSLGNIAALRPILSSGTLRIHPLALKHLDLVPMYKNQQGGTLFDLLDQCVTAMGSRSLKTTILRPMMDIQTIKKRQNGVTFFYDHLSLRKNLRDRLKQMSDLERLIARISLNASQPRDLIALKNSVSLLPEIQKTLLQLDDATTKNLHPAVISDLLSDWDNIESIVHTVTQAIVPEPPFSLKEGGVIQTGYLPELDELRRFQKEGRSMLSQIEQQERQRTGIDSLKIRYNQVHGYYIEVSKSHLSKIPPDYIRKQTLANAERYMTKELKTLEEKLTGAKEALIALEAQVFEEIRYDLSQETARVQHMAKAVALLDLLSALAETAQYHHYCKPELQDDGLIQITEGRHPVLESGMTGGKESFIPNDAYIHPTEAPLLILTGPNMAGKSTYMRQIALIVLMAQMGSYVPASKAVIGVTDQIFTRVGAQDALNEGMSTFMVEMTEMSQILRHATEKSLILLDEIGRGTSTFDGISIAWAIAEYVHNTLKARTLFATHYHELTGLSMIYPGIKNFHVLVREWGEEIVFLRKMVEGGSDKSYGIQVGRLAGLPSDIIHRAKAVLKTLDQNAGDTPLHTHFLDASTSEKAQQPGLFSPPPSPPQVQRIVPDFTDHPVLSALNKIDPMHLTPLQALQVLADLKAQMEEKTDHEPDIGLS